MSSGQAVSPCSLALPVDLVSELQFAVFRIMGKQHFQACFLIRTLTEARTLPASGLSDGCPA